jgi:hypothetical protein
MQISFTINRAGRTDLRPCSFTPIADDIVWQRALDTGEFLHYMHTTLLLGAGLWSSERPSRYYRENPSRFMLQTSLNHWLQNTYVNMPLFSHQNIGQVGGTAAHISREILQASSNEYIIIVQKYPASTTPTTGLLGSS